MSRVIMAVINEAGGGGGGSEGGAKAAVSYLVSIITTLSISCLRQIPYKPSPRHYEGNL